MKAHSQSKRRRRDLHFLNEDGMVVCNPRDSEAAHRAEFENIATENGGHQKIFVTEGPG